MRRFILFALLWVLLVAAVPTVAQVGFPFPGPGTAHTTGGGGNITFDNTSTLGNNGGSGNFSTSYTGSTLTNGMLVACIMGSDMSDSSPVPSYNSVNMTLAASVASASTFRWVYTFYLLNPASGSNTFAVTQTGGDYLIVNVAEYAGAKQSTQPDATKTDQNQAEPLTSALTVGTNNSWIVACIQMFGSGPNATGAVNTLRVTDGFGQLHLFDSNGGVSTGSQSSTYNSGGGAANVQLVQTSFKPN
jgi:hypothetical protein